CLFNTALRAAASPEAPHLYHIGEYYYLIIADGGTEFFHAVTTARGKSLHEFFEGYAGNPVLTHRNMGRKAKITNVGHADLVQLPDDSWYAVFLASRPVDHKYKTIGRETFICPVIWEDGWPVFSPETGKVEDEYDAPACLPWTPYDAPAARDDFDAPGLSPYLVQWGTPDKDFWYLDGGSLHIRCVAEKVDTEPVAFSQMTGNEEKFAPYISRRMTSFDAAASCAMDFTPRGNESAGLAITQAINNNLLLEKVSAEGKDVIRFVLVKTVYNCPPYIPGFKSSTERLVIGETEAIGSRTELCLKVRGAAVEAYADGTKIGDADIGELFPDAKSGGMVGTMIGMFASGNGADTDNEAAFDWFEME
ncbi:MAG: family 43 glycosylhydrolase, partial [Lachnospiraceae bacterium]|nr:family 43 glycosylhydrolase [Lachnospiraceae bacterium]